MTGIGEGKFYRNRRGDKIGPIKLLKTPIGPYFWSGSYQWDGNNETPATFTKVMVTALIIGGAVFFGAAIWELNDPS